MSADAKNSHKDKGVASSIDVEADIEGQPNPATFAIPAGPSFLALLRKEAGVGDDAYVFERDAEDPLEGVKEGRKALRVLLHRCKKVRVEARYNSETIAREFSPAATVLRVLTWAIGKRGFGLDPSVAPKANLILPGATSPLPKEALIGVYVDGRACVLVVDVTLQDFTNGR